MTFDDKRWAIAGRWLIVGIESRIVEAEGSLALPVWEFDRLGSGEIFREFRIAGHAGRLLQNLCPSGVESQHTNPGWRSRRAGAKHNPVFGGAYRRKVRPRCFERLHLTRSEVNLGELPKTLRHV